MDVEACRIDFLAADAHKWLLSPEGIAVFYSRDEARDGLQLLQQGWHMSDNPWQFDRQDWTPSQSAKRFEAGTPNTMGQAAFHASTKLLLDFGMENVGRRVLANTDHLIQSLGELPGFNVNCPSSPERRSGIVTFGHERVAIGDLHGKLVRAGVSCVVRGGRIRLSPHFYQGESQICAVIEILEKL